MKKLNSRGFTITELVIASLVFSSVLILCMQGITRITNVYVKNSSIFRTNEFVKSFVSDITQQIRFGAEPLITYTPTPPAIPFPATYFPDTVYLCVSGNAYRVLFRTQTNPIVKKSVSDCTNYNVATNYSTGIENIAPSKMRVLNLEVFKTANPSIYTVRMRVALGDADLLESTSGAALLETSGYNLFSNAKCRSSIPGSEFCSVIDISTSVSKRMVK